jgi:hypothetical protein
MAVLNMLTDTFSFCCPVILGMRELGVADASLQDSACAEHGLCASCRHNAHQIGGEVVTSRYFHHKAVLSTLDRLYTLV